jgi:predicted NodU family carbamoyl transferase
MRILSYNPGHDGAVAYLRDGQLVFSIEAEKDSNYRYMPVSADDVLAGLGLVDEIPDVVCVGGWWRSEARPIGSAPHAGYRGIEAPTIMVENRKMFGQVIRHFSSSHERSHLLCAYGMSGLPKGTPCYALIWEGAIGAFYEIDAEANVTPLGDVMDQPGNRYCSIYGLADPTFPKNAPFSRFSDAGKLMALASFSRRSEATPAEEELMRFLLSSPDVRLDMYDKLANSPYFDVGVEDAQFRDFAGIYSDRIFEAFHTFARANMRKGLPLVVAGGCGLNCDWNTKWVETGLFAQVFVPPVANDSGSAIGTAIDAQLRFTGDATIEWDVYAGLEFEVDRAFETSRYEMVEATPELVADLLASNLILGWVNGRWEIGPRALGNRSILAAPFADATRIRLNEIKQREQFRPIAPMCLREDAARWFGCIDDSPYMLFTHRATTDALAAVTHVNGTARLQTVTKTTNAPLHDLLVAFRKRTGYGVLCNTSLNFNGKGFINNIADLDTYAFEHGLDGFVVQGRAYLLKSSQRYQARADRAASFQTGEATRAGR